MNFLDREIGWVERALLNYELMSNEVAKTSLPIVWDVTEHLRIAEKGRSELAEILNIPSESIIRA